MNDAVMRRHVNNASPTSVNSRIVNNSSAPYELIQDKAQSLLFYFMPIITATILLGTLVLMYVIAVLQGHVEPILPYISDAGTLPPESCFFSQVLNMYSIMIGLLTYLRYREVEHFLQGKSPWLHTFNKVGFWIGIISYCSLSIVGNFQVSNQFLTHMASAGTAFTLLQFTMWIQVYFSYLMIPAYNTKTMAHVRTTLAFISTTASIVLAIAGIISKREFNGTDRLKWRPEDGGWGMHVVSSAGEWIMVFAAVIFTTTFAQDSKRAYVHKLQISFFPMKESKKRKTSD